MFLVLLFFSLLGGSFSAVAHESNCSVLLLRWASAETMPDFWREIKADRVLAERPAQKFLAWVMASALRIDREKVALEWEKTVQAEFMHTWQQRSWAEDFRFYHLMGEIIYGMKNKVSDDLFPLVQDLQQAHAWGLLKGAKISLHHLGLEREQYLAVQKEPRAKTDSPAVSAKGATMIRASFNQVMREIFQAIDVLIPDQALELRRDDTTISDIREEVLQLQFKWETEEMIFAILEAKLKKSES